MFLHRIGALLATLLLAKIALVTGKKGGVGWRTTYACEGKALHLECGGGLLLHLVRANYGRFSISICNEHGHLDWRVNCMSTRSFLVMQERCNLKPNCSVNVSSTTFHDPCPGTLKYLEVQYHCGTGVPALVPSTASSGSNATTYRPPLLTPAFNSIIIRESITTTTTPATTSPSTAAMSGEYCPATVSRGVSWPWTHAGETAHANCPDAAGTAKWACLASSRWDPELPDFLNCHSLWLDNLRERFQNGDSIISIASELAVMSSSKLLFSEDLKIVSSLIQEALYKSVNSMENFLDTWHRYHVLRELLQWCVQTLSHMLSAEGAWQTMGGGEQRALLSALLRRLEGSAQALADVSDHEAAFVAPNVWLSLRISSANRFQFPAVDSNISDWQHMQDSITIESKNVGGGLYKVVFSVFHKLHEYLGVGNGSVLNSRVIGAAPLPPHHTLQRPVHITLKHLQEENVTNPVCVFWDFHLSDWSPQGCWMGSHNKSHTVCLCDHLTHFALVMDLQADRNVPDEVTFLLHLVITTGCITAIVSLLLTLVILFLIRWEEDFMSRQLLLCLLLAEAVFVWPRQAAVAGGIECALVAGALHCLLLAVAAWACLDAFHLYYSAVVVNPRCFALLAYTLSTGLAALSTSLAPAHHCWQPPPTLLLVAPAALLVTGGSVFLVLTTVADGKDSTTKYRSWRSLFLLVLLSLTWSFASVSTESLALACTFAVLNSLLGLSILCLFCFHNQVKEDLRKALSYSLCCFKQRKEPIASRSASRNNCETHEFWTLPKEKQSSNTVQSESTTFWEPIYETIPDNSAPLVALWDGDKVLNRLHLQEPLPSSFC